MKRPKDDIAAQLKNAQIHLVEKALVGWLEELTGKVVSDEEALANGRWANFAPTLLSIFEKDGWQWSTFYVWKNEFAVAIGFPNTEDLLALKYVELRKEEWPTALRLFIANQDEMREKGPEV